MRRLCQICAAGALAAAFLSEAPQQLQLSVSACIFLLIAADLR